MDELKFLTEEAAISILSKIIQAKLFFASPFNRLNKNDN